MANTDTQNGLTIVRTFNAPRELVFKAWSEADRLAQWWGPKGFKLHIASLDFRPGGRFHYSMSAPDGNMMWGLFVYGNIISPELIEFTNSFSDEAGNVAPAPFLDGKFPTEIFNIVTFAGQDGKTTVTLKGGPVNATDEQKQTYLSMTGNMQEGFAGTFQQLDEYLASITG